VQEVQVEGSLTSKVGESLRAAIVSGELTAGELYSVHDLAGTLGVSRTPVREALIQLASKGMVQFERNRGVRILETTAHDLEEVFELRLLLEVPAARLAVARIDHAGIASLEELLRQMGRAADEDSEQSLMAHDRRFHRLILEAAGNHRLAAFVDSLRDMVLTRGVSTAGASRSLRAIADEHVAILERIKAGDADGAADAMRAHVLHTAQLLLHRFAASAETVNAWAAQVDRTLGV
jgi:DNA-binding GntR family transcriptional regulator